MPEDDRHAIQVCADLNVRGSFTATCACGWMSGDEGDRGAAEAAGAQHVQDPVRRPVRTWEPEGS